MAEGDGSFRNLSAPPLGLLEHASLKMRPIQNPIQQSTRQITPERIVEVPRICIKRKFKLDAIQKRCPQNFCLPRDLLTKFCSHFAPKACQPEVRIQLRHSREQHCSISLDSEARRTLDQAGKLAFGLIIALLSPHPGDVALAAGHAEPGNALSIPTWVIHISSVIEWTTAMILMWRYAEVTGNEKWKGMTWGMMPLFTGALTACTYHFFYNSPDIDFLVAIQASLTWIGNATLWLAAYRIFKDTESPSPSILRKRYGKFPLLKHLHSNSGSQTDGASLYYTDEVSCGMDCWYHACCNGRCTDAMARQARQCHRGWVTWMPRLIAASSRAKQPRPAENAAR